MSVSDNCTKCTARFYCTFVHTEIYDCLTLNSVLKVYIANIIFEGNLKI